MEGLTCKTLSCLKILPQKETGKRRDSTRKTSKRINEEFKNLCKKQRLKEAFDLFFHNQIKPNKILSCSSYGLLLQACSKERFIEGVLQVHVQIIKKGFEDQFVYTNLLNACISCGDLSYARQVFDTRTARKSLIAWNMMIGRYCQFGLLEEALFLFCELQRYGFEPDQFTFSVVIKEMEPRNMFLGKQIHSLSIKNGYAGDEFVGNSLIQMYADCGRIEDSLRVFEKNLETGCPVTWNSIIARLVENEFYRYGLELYKQMLENGIELTALTFSSVMKACGGVKVVSEGEQVHAQVIVHGFSLNAILETALINFYVKCGELEKGRQVFEEMNERNVMTWNSLIRGYSQMGHVEEALKLFRMMREDRFVPDKFTFPALLIGAAMSSKYSEEFKSLHACIIKVGLETDQFIGTSLVEMYSTGQSVEDARSAFDDINSKDMGLWSSMISAYIHNSKPEEALGIFSKMLYLDIEPNQSIYSSLFMACADLSTLEAGKQIHAHSLKSIYPFDVASKNSLLIMYSDCGCIKEAWTIFDMIENPNVISFNSMISALAEHGFPTEAMDLFKQMMHEGLKPDEITLLALLSAFAHAGLVREGFQLFYSMKENHGIEPSYRHYACIVDLLARAGLIEEAEKFANEMPFEPSPSLWQVILGSCSKHKNVEIGKRVAELLLELEPDEATTYVLLANIYAKSGRWTESEKIKNLMEERGIKKGIGISWIEINKEIHVFGVEDRSHPQSNEIYKELGELIIEIKGIGYVPDITFAAHHIEDERREESLYYHSEKLAFAFGNLFTPPGIPIHIMKNLRTCGDCHNANKYFSLITGREIILRDNQRFHHFKEGQCSCGDYW